MSVDVVALVCDRLLLSCFCWWLCGFVGCVCCLLLLAVVVCCRVLFMLFVVLLFVGVALCSCVWLFVVVA